MLLQIFALLVAGGVRIFFLYVLSGIFFILVFAVEFSTSGLTSLLGSSLLAGATTSMRLYTTIFLGRLSSTFFNAVGGLISPFGIILSLAFSRFFLMLQSPGVSFLCHD